MINENTKPQFLFLNRKGEVMEFSPFLGSGNKNEVIFAPFGGGMRHIPAEVTIIDVGPTNKNPLGDASFDLTYTLTYTPDSSEINPFHDNKKDLK